MFRRISGLVWDITTGGIGLETANGVYSLSIAHGATPSDPKIYGVNVNPIEGLGVKIPAFATQSTFEEVNEGDIVVGDAGIIGWVTGKTGAALKVLDHNGNNKTYSPPKVQILGSSGILVVRNLFSFTGGADGAAGFASNLLPLLMLGGNDGDSKLEKLLPLLLLTSQAGAAGGAAGAPAANPMASILPLMLLKDGGLGGKGGDLKDMLPLLMMTGGLGGAGAGGMNPMVMMALLGDGDLFGSDKAPKALAPVTRGGIPVLQNGL